MSKSIRTKGKPAGKNKRRAGRAVDSPTHQASSAVRTGDTAPPPALQEVPLHFHRLKRGRETIKLRLSPAVKRLLMKHFQKSSWRSVAVMVEAMILAYATSPKTCRSLLINGNYYEPHDSSAGRRYRRRVSDRMYRELNHLPRANIMREIGDS
jgi:hypothetical protein